MCCNNPGIAHLPDREALRHTRMRPPGLPRHRVLERDLAECVALNDASAAIHCEQSPVGQTSVGRSQMGHTLAQ